jgi:hypothetical protein
MTRGIPYSDDLQAVLVNMATHLDIDSIVQYTDGRCSRWSIERVISEFQRTRTAARRKRKDLRGLKRSLSADNTRVWFCFYKTQFCAELHTLSSFKG